MIHARWSSPSALTNGSVRTVTTSEPRVAPNIRVTLSRERSVKSRVIRVFSVPYGITAALRAMFISA